MPTPAAIKLNVADWCLDPVAGEISRHNEVVRLEPRTLRLLQCLAARAGEIVSADELLEQVWPGVVVTPDSVYQAIAALRRLLGDDPKHPRYIETVPRLGYRMIALVTPENALMPLPANPAAAFPPPRFNKTAKISILMVFALLMGWSGFHYLDKPGSVFTTAPLRSVAVLPFLDLTDQMGEEYFADGMTEELIGRFSKVPGLRVPAPTASFFFKGKQLALPEIAGKLGVAYIVDGSVRKSGAVLRISARLVRADDGFIIWTGTYDRPVNDLLAVQDEIANEVTTALKANIKG